MFRKVLVANRGEIAVRLLRALREQRIPSVAVYSEADRASLHVRLADEAVAIGPAPSSESYLRIDRLVDAARQTGAEAIHPGYGFLSENADFAQACLDAGITFIGPGPGAIRAMGVKTEARRVARAAGVSGVPGTDSPLQSAREARDLAAGLGYPVMLKAAAGGGGKGMRLVRAEGEMEAAFRDASGEAERAFKSGDVYLEKFIESPRHIEIQILGDSHGHMIHLGERECSLQRRHQKIIEECPSPLVAAYPELRARMGEAAVRVARAAGYTNAGTVEFLVDRNRAFYFLEMNTRLQVEHPVTELVTGLDLVAWQLRIAAGERLTIAQDDVRGRGWSIECRVCAEDPEHGFLPSPGKIAALREPAGPGIRVDSGVYPGWTVPLEYDPLLAKLAGWASSRDEAIQKLRRALGEYSIQGIRCNLRLLADLLDSDGFRRGDLHTGFVEQFLAARGPSAGSGETAAVAALVAAIEHHSQQAGNGVAGPAPSGRWRLTGRDDLLR